VIGADANDPLGFGIDWTECGVVKFLRAQIVDELTPWLCASTTSPPRPPRPVLRLGPVRLPQAAGKARPPLVSRGTGEDPASSHACSPARLGLLR